MPKAVRSQHYTDYAAKLAAANAAAAVLMREVRAVAAYLQEDHGYSLTSFEAVTGLHKNSLMRLMDPTWVPKPPTLQKLDRLIARARRSSAAAGRARNEAARPDVRLR
jgi:hypothetical protein